MDLEREGQALDEVQKTQDEAQHPPSEPKPSTSTRTQKFHGLHTHLTTEISTSNATPIMLTCCLISGLVDSSIYNAYGTFVSMQTGNTIFLGLGGATSVYQPPSPKPYAWAKSLTSIACFCLGCFFFSHFSRWMGPLKRGTLAASFALQSLLVLVAAVVVQTGVVDGNLGRIPSDVQWRSEIPIAVLSFQSAGQIIGSRTLNLAEIPSVVLTSMLCDLASDPNLVGPLKSNIKRNRRVMAFLGILVGAVVGGFISEGTGKVGVVLWIAFGLKVLISVAWLVWPAKKPSVI
ncbi:hypothetical protein ACLMJK_001873 [Lecanora helva]